MTSLLSMVLPRHPWESPLSSSFSFASESPRLTALIRIALGLVLLCEGQLTQPHPVIELEGLLIAPNGQEVARFTHQSRASDRICNQWFRVDARANIGQMPYYPASREFRNCRAAL